MSERVGRQDEETTVPEVCGIPISEFKVYFHSEDPINVGVLYLRLGDNWHRFYLDAGLLFWQNRDAVPDPDDDLEDGQDYINWGEELGVIGVALSEVDFRDLTLTMRFENGAEVVLQDFIREVETRVMRFKPGVQA
jgi:hypothetical protein